MCGVEAAAGEEHARVGQRENGRPEQLAGRVGRADRPEPSEDGIVDLDLGDEPTTAGAAGDEHLAVVEKVQADVPAARRLHRSRCPRERVRARVVDLGRVEVDVARPATAGQQHGAAQQQRRARPTAGNVERRRHGDRARLGIVELGDAQRTGGVGATRDEDAPIR